MLANLICSRTRLFRLNHIRAMVTRQRARKSLNAGKRHAWVGGQNEVCSLVAKFQKKFVIFLWLFLTLILFLIRKSGRLVTHSQSGASPTPENTFEVLFLRIPLSQSPWQHTCKAHDDPPFGILRVSQGLGVGWRWVERWFWRKSICLKCNAGRGPAQPREIKEEPISLFLPNIVLFLVSWIVSLNL